MDEIIKVFIHWGLSYAVVCCDMQADAFSRLQEIRANQADVYGLPQPDGNSLQRSICSILIAIYLRDVTVLAGHLKTRKPRTLLKVSAFFLKTRAQTVCPSAYSITFQL